MSELFYSPRISASTVVLQDSEAHHAINVLRMKQHDTIRLFDGKGTTAEGHIAAISRREVQIAVETVVVHQRPERPRLFVAAAPPKGDRLKWMIEKLTELGVDRFIPLQTSRSVVHPGASKLDKLNATIVSAAKQSGNIWMMELSPPVSFRELLAQHDSHYVLAHPSPPPNASESDCPPSPAADSQTILIGPEGGFSDEEVEYADQKNSQRISWPGSILRIETAAVVFATMAMSPQQNTQSLP